MKKILYTYGLGLIVVVFSANNLLAQDLKTFPVNCEPQEISVDKAQNDATILMKTCGFGSAFLSKQDLQDLLSIENCVGIRIYISMVKSGQEYADLTAVAINKDGKEIGNSFQRFYLSVNSLDEGYPAYAKGLNHYEAEKYVKNINSGKSGLSPYVAYLGSDGAKYLLETDCDGIRIYPSDIELEGKSYHSMAFGAVSFSKGDLINVSDTYLQAMHPCPIECGADGDKNYLWNQ